MLIGHTINIRHLQPSELDAWIAAKNDVATMGDFTTFQITSPVIVHNEFAQNGLASDAMETFAIVGKFDQLIGTICHFPATGYASARELGFSIFVNEFRNQGIATEAVTLLVKYLFDNKPINRLQIVMPVAHLACEKIALKCGFVKEGVARGLLFIRGEYCDCNVYALLRNDVNNLQNNKN
ncbi:MAG TPA: GNAT family protein [Cellvibrio sp.]